MKQEIRSDSGGSEGFVDVSPIANALPSFDLFVVVVAHRRKSKNTCTTHGLVLLIWVQVLEGSQVERKEERRVLDGRHDDSGDAAGHSGLGEARALVAHRSCLGGKHWAA